MTDRSRRSRAAAPAAHDAVPVSSRPAAVLVLGTAEWSAPIATNQHHVVRELAGDHEVFFAEGTGTRAPRLRPADLRRIASRADPRRRVETRGLPGGAALVPLRLLPHAWRGTGAVNRPWLRRQVAAWLQSTGPRVLWSYTPYTYGLERQAGVVVHHLVDLVHHNDGVDVQGYRAAESTLAARADLAIATSPAIGAHLRAVGFRSVLTLPNVADTGVFLAGDEPAPSRSAPERTADVVFAGAVSAQKLDARLLERLAAAVPPGSRLVLVGPVGSGADDLRLVTRLVAAGAVLRPTLDPHQLAVMLRGCAVGIVPYAMNALTVGISPLKVYEYLACSLPVVSTALPAVTPVPGAVFVEPDHEAFIRRVLSLLEQDPGRSGGLRPRLARQNSWSGRGHHLRLLVDSLLADGPGGTVPAPRCADAGSPERVSRR